MDENVSCECMRLDSIAVDSLYAKGAGPAMIQYCSSIFGRHIRGDSILELGPAEGLMTEFLDKLTSSLTIVDGSKVFCDALQERFPHCNVINSLFESYVPEMRFDNIILGHVLEHVVDPIALLQRVSCWLSPRGRVFAAVPNSRSIHRQAAVIMGLLDREDQLNGMDHHHGHRRVYNPETFRGDFSAAGLAIEIFGGYWLKPVSNGQIEATWTNEMLEAFMQLGERYPDISAEIYIVAGPKLN